LLVLPAGKDIVAGEIVVHVVHAPIVDRHLLAGFDIPQRVVGHVAIVGLQVGHLGMVHVPADRDAQEVDRRPVATCGPDAEALEELLVR